MSKKIFIYRHAKSDWGAKYGNDHERPLSDRGMKSAKLMGKLLVESKQLPELVISSSALRARQTVEISIKEGNWDCEVRIDEGLYYNGFREIFESLKLISSNYTSVMLVSHEPKCSSLCSYMIGGGEIVFSTAAMARIDYNFYKWNEIKPGLGQLKWFQRPSFLLKGKSELSKEFLV